MLYMNTGSSSSDWSEETGEGVPLHHGEHGGGEDRGESRDEATFG